MKQNQVGKDLVTELDKATQDFLIEKIQAFDPEAKILGEENGLDRLSDFSGRVFIIDPIDGTMNFVLEKENFCIMIAVYEEGQGRFGFVYNVMKNEFLLGWSGNWGLLQRKKNRSAERYRFRGRIDRIKCAHVDA